MISDSKFMQLKCQLPLNFWKRVFMLNLVLWDTLITSYVLQSSHICKRKKKYIEYINEECSVTRDKDQLVDMNLFLDEVELLEKRTEFNDILSTYCVQLRHYSKVFVRTMKRFLEFVMNHRDSKLETRNVYSSNSKKFRCFQYRRTLTSTRNMKSKACVTTVRMF